ncbi:hypothetical protein OC845_005362 [Tilletia horrida]|nr:hypothetical protein OC845_005362 [Tilletia horrida]
MSTSTPSSRSKSASKPSFASVAAAKANLSNESSAATANQASSTGAPHSITTEHVDRKTGENYKITKYRDNTSVAGGFTKLGVSSSASPENKRSSPNRAGQHHSQQRTPSPPQFVSSKPSNLAARRAAAQHATQETGQAAMRKPLAPIAVNAYSTLLRSELSPASFGPTPSSARLSPSPTNLNAGRRSPYAPIPSPTNVSPHIATAYYEQSAKKGSATYNDDGELEEDEDEEETEAPVSLSPFGPPSPMMIPHALTQDVNAEVLLAYQAMLAPPPHMSSASASLAGAYLKYLEAQANLNHFVSSTLDNSAMAPTSAPALPMSTTTPNMQGQLLPSYAPQLTPEVLAALAQQELVAAQTLKNGPSSMPAPLSSPAESKKGSASAGLLASIHQTPASFRYTNNGQNRGTPTSQPLSAAATPISPVAWRSRPNVFGGVPATPFSPFDSSSGRHLLSSASAYSATPSAVSATSSTYSSPLPSPASSLSSLPESDMMLRSDSTQSMDSATTYSSMSSFKYHGGADIGHENNFGKMSKQVFNSDAHRGGAPWGSDADWSVNWRKRGPLDYDEPSTEATGLTSPLGRASRNSPTSLATFDLNLDLTSVDHSFRKLGLGHPLDMPSVPGAPVSRPIGLPASAYADGYLSPAGNRVPPTPTLLDQEFVEGLMRTGYSEDEAHSSTDLSNNKLSGTASSSPLVGGNIGPIGMLGLSGARKLNPMLQIDMETPLARDVARF